MCIAAWSAIEPMGFVRQQHRHRDDRVAGLGCADPVFAVLRVAEVVDGGDGPHEGQRHAEVHQPAPPRGEAATQRPVDDQARQDGQQECIDRAVDAAAPDQLKDVVRTVRVRSGVLGEHVAHQRDAEDEAEQAAQLPVARQRRSDVERGAPHVRGAQRQYRGEVDREVQVVMQGEDARAEVGNGESDDGGRAKPTQLCAPRLGMCAPVGVRAGGKVMREVHPACFHADNVSPAYRPGIRDGPRVSFPELRAAGGARGRHGSNERTARRRRRAARPSARRLGQARRTENRPRLWRVR